jgi:hypothetical protein
MTRDPQTEDEIREALREIVEAGVNDAGHEWHAVYPVLALESCVERVNVKRLPAGQLPDTDFTERERLRKGWNLEGQRARRAALFVVEGGDLATSDDPRAPAEAGAQAMNQRA